MTSNRRIFVSASEGTIVERLTAQRTLLVDVVRQLDTAIAVFGGTNGHTPVKGSGNWIATASPAKKAAWRRKISASQKLRRAAQQPTTETF